MSRSSLGRQTNRSPSLSQGGQPDNFVFLDRRGKRWPRFRRLMFGGGILAFLAIVLFIRTLLLPPQLNKPPALVDSLSAIKTAQSKKTQSEVSASKPVWLKYAKKHSSHTKSGQQSDSSPGSTMTGTAVKALAAGSGKEIRLGLYMSHDTDSLDSLKAHANHLTHLCPDWLSFAQEVGRLDIVSEAGVLEEVRKQRLELLPLLRNLGEGDVWMPEAVEALINGPPERQDRFLADLTETLVNMEADGVVLDWQQVDPSYRSNMTTFLGRMAEALHRENLEVWLCVSTGSDLQVFDLDTLAHRLDRFVAMLHDEHAEFDTPGPIASHDFFNGWLDTLVKGYGKPAQWVISLGSYGYEWTDGKETGEQISFADTMSRAGRSAQTICTFHLPSFNPHFNYEEGSVSHSVWFLDAVTFLNQLTAVRSHRAAGIAVNRLGTEDPGIWEVLASFPSGKPRPEDLVRLEPMPASTLIAKMGQGNLITIKDTLRDGHRRLHLEKQAKLGGVVTATYQQFPHYLTINHQGRTLDDAVALTFDDGPDSEWTPRILDILKAHKVKATFFMIGANMEKNPGIVERVLAEGHMIGVHTYSHPNIAEVSAERAQVELNATQRLIESITGHSTILFRPPYNADTNPHDPEELVPIRLAQDMGYVTITEDIDPEDWDEPGVNTMVERVKRARLNGGDIVLLHDAGGDRRQTVEALPKIITYLQNRGDRILPLPELIGIPAEQLMPVIPVHQQPLTRLIIESGFMAIHELTNFFWAFMIVATVLTIAKTLAVSWLAVRSRRQEASAHTAGDPIQFTPPVSVLIAAYNEEKVIRDTLRAVGNTLYPGEIEIVVVDDGSTDATAAIVTALAKQDSRIRLIRQANAGEAMALGNQLAVCLDADTQFTPQTIGHLIQPFADQKVGAVSGRARVGNPKTLIARFQSLEYTCGFNLDRRAFHQLNCITVVPGAVSALRLSAVMEAGGISTETLAEDTDLTLALHKCGYRIHYAPRAIAWTEAPETVHAFAKQRFRWAFGTLQCLWKHRELLFHPRFKALGWFSLPSAWFFNIFLVAIGSLIDLLLLLSLVVSPANAILYWYFAIFLAADLVLAAVACLVEREPLAQAWLVLPMRFIYRPVLNYVVVRAILRALKGVWVGWGKLDRTASVAYRT
jgi:peptidoglycan-N-acetylglucosamine deacetylase